MRRPDPEHAPGISWDPGSIVETFTQAEFEGLQQFELGNTNGLATDLEPMTRRRYILHRRPGRNGFTQVQDRHTKGQELGRQIKADMVEEKEGKNAARTYKPLSLRQLPVEDPDYFDDYIDLNPSHY